MTPLMRILRTRIAAEGPIPVADFMAESLLHPVHGYYATRDPLGARGDFTTAPEISQMFGELIGLCLAQSWLDQGAPASFTLAELGPGRGTMMADILRATARVPGFHDAAGIYLVEASATLRARQAEVLAGHAPTWLDNAADLPDAPLWLVANEFFDALPIRQYVRNGAAWCERRVGQSDEGLRFGSAAPAPVSALAHRLDDAKDGDLVEHCPAATTIIQTVGQRIADHGGAALIADYGDWRSLGDTLQALQAHASVDPLAAPGEADLTAHVDFEALARATPSAHTRLTTQGVFLERLGITARAQQLAEVLSGTARESHIAAHRRLTHPSEMGTLFKLLGLFPQTAPPPPGLDA
ncbi:class I SAM-dependent methyltransferase [Primorskyibacter marinus]|uniref:class I SAM-dependent methyltransferase n=1 Tax=Primorskyibacter marinus TaxID=1977320 RepID=UPI001E30B76F|nr:SAM-dependent methyltransferase [Primorskyibacter marinus]